MAYEVDNSSDTVEQFLHLYQTGDLSDLEIKVSNKKFKTHRLVLCMASDVLKTMLTSKFWPEGRSDRVVLQEDPECVPVFESFLQYLYTGKVVLNQVEVLPLLILADKYNVSSLSRSCLQYMNRMCCQETIQYVLPWLQYAVICGYRNLEDVCEEFITNNFDSVMRINEFVSISKESLVKFLANSDIVVASEFDLYTAVKKWVTFNASIEELEEKVLFEFLMKHIRFPMMQLSELLKLEKDVFMLKYKDFFFQNIFSCLRYHIGSQIEFPRNRLKAYAMESLFFPRIYPKETWSTEIVLENVSRLAEGEVRGAFFSTPVSCSDTDQHNHHDWNVMFYPKGVKYEPCLMIGVPNNLIPGGVFKTVRLAFCTNCETRTRFKISVLIMGPTNRVHGFVCSTVTKDAIFDKNCRRFNLENVIPYEEIYDANSRYKIDWDTLHLKIIIRPLCPLKSNLQSAV